MTERRNAFSRSLIKAVLKGRGTAPKFPVTVLTNNHLIALGKPGFSTRQPDRTAAYFRPFFPVSPSENAGLRGLARPVNFGAVRCF